MKLESVSNKSVEIWNVSKGTQIDRAWKWLLQITSEYWWDAVKAERFRNKAEGSVKIWPRLSSCPSIFRWIFSIGNFGNSIVFLVTFPRVTLPYVCRRRIFRVSPFRFQDYYDIRLHIKLVADYTVVACFLLTRIIDNFSAFLFRRSSSLNTCGHIAYSARSGRPFHVHVGLCYSIGLLSRGLTYRLFTDMASEQYVNTVNCC